MLGAASRDVISIPLSDTQYGLTTAAAITETHITKECIITVVINEHKSAAFQNNQRVSTIKPGGKNDHWVLKHGNELL